MKLTVAANYDAGLIERLASYPVDEVFGKFPVDFVGGGRPSYMGTPLTRKVRSRTGIPMHRIRGGILGALS